MRPRCRCFPRPRPRSHQLPVDRMTRLQVMLAQKQTLAVLAIASALAAKEHVVLEVVLLVRLTDRVVKLAPDLLT